MKLLTTLALALIGAGLLVSSPTSSAGVNLLQSRPTTILTATRLLDVRSGRILNGQAVLVERDRIKAVGVAGSIRSQAPRATTIDLGDATLLPGLIDCHTHILLQGDITSEEYDSQVLKESIPFRTI